MNTTTNGNDPTEGDIVELAFHITNLEEPWTHRGSIEHRISPGNYDEFVSRLSPSQLRLYEESGTLGLIQHGAHTPLEEVEDDIMDFFENYGKPGHFLMGGRDLRVERRWLECWMPELNNWFMDHTLDLNVVSALISQTGNLASDLEVPSQPELVRSHSMAERYCVEFMYYIELLKTVPLLEDAPV